MFRVLCRFSTCRGPWCLPFWSTWNTPVYLMPADGVILLRSHCSTQDQKGRTEPPSSEAAVQCCSRRWWCVWLLFSWFCLLGGVLQLGRMLHRGCCCTDQIPVNAATIPWQAGMLSINTHGKCWITCFWNRAGKVIKWKGSPLVLDTHWLLFTHFWLCTSQMYCDSHKSWLPWWHISYGSISISAPMILKRHSYKL